MLFRASSSPLWCTPRLFSVGKVTIEVIVEQLLAFRSLDKHEANRRITHRSVTKFFPIDAFLIVAYVDATNLVAFGEGRFAIDGTPTEAERVNKKVIEKAYVGCRDEQTAKPKRPRRHTSEQAQEAEPTGSLLSLPAGLPSLTARFPPLRMRYGLFTLLVQGQGSLCTGHKPRLVPSTGLGLGKRSKCSLPIPHACWRRT